MLPAAAANLPLPQTPFPPPAHLSSSCSRRSSAGFAMRVRLAALLCLWK
jgi:hypothetical protein